MLKVTFPCGFPAFSAWLIIDLVSLLYNPFSPLFYSQNSPLELFVPLGHVSVIVINYCESSRSF